MNTNLYATNNPTTEAESDPGEQYAWIEGVLSAARTNNEKVTYILGEQEAIRLKQLRYSYVN